MFSRTGRAPKDSSQKCPYMQRYELWRIRALRGKLITPGIMSDWQSERGGKATKQGAFSVIPAIQTHDARA